jgi:hypothetical protein
MKIFLLGLTLATLSAYVCFAQTVAAPRKSAIAGQVVNASTGDPCGGVQVMLHSADSSSRAAVDTKTDAYGHFLFTKIKPGSYLLTAARRGFVEAESGLGSAGRPGLTAIRGLDRLVTMAAAATIATIHNHFRFRTGATGELSVAISASCSGALVLSVTCCGTFSDGSNLVFGSDFRNVVTISLFPKLEFCVIL